MTFEMVKVAAGIGLLLVAFAALVGFRPSRLWRKDSKYDVGGGPETNSERDFSTFDGGDGGADGGGD